MNERPTHLDLFSGIGGFVLAAQWAGFRTVAFCEIDKYCQKVLAKNFMADAAGVRSEQATNGRKSRQPVPVMGSAPIIPNIFDLDGRQFAGIDLITGGFPCQPFSVAGKRRGAEDDRHLWPEMLRVISEARPAWIVGENVPGIIPMELDNVLSDLEGIGYATRSFVIPACAVDARHRRDRLWIIGRNISDSFEQRGCVGNTEREHASDAGQRSESQGNDARGVAVWDPEPNVGGSLDGLSRRLDEIGLSNEAITRATKIVFDVWETDVAEAFQWNVGRFNSVSEEEILLTFLCEYEEKSSKSWTPLESRTNAISIMRNLWRDIESSRSPYRRRYSKQLSREYSDALRKLPREASSLFSEAWRGSCWEDGMQRVAHKIPSRVDRLKGLGNAIVPQVAYEILRVIRQLC